MYEVRCTKYDVEKVRYEVKMLGGSWRVILSPSTTLRTGSVERCARWLLGWVVKLRFLITLQASQEAGYCFTLSGTLKVAWVLCDFEDISYC